ncbi:OLC1v1038758C1 [Oldenlandia corymbosa var. corymbosa]|uniref:OLC1v1038758C1 n=1 Tax=Oldenlandia corymbosa var. corymbosa TaxID=529605 RepID=A0AAV1D3N1_OLDCO|nr:OLC1v1038758C1 [Oldenlandia corymbosa var. corymbosa]
MAMNQSGLGPIFSFRSGDFGGYMTDLEKRQLFLRSYQFSRKKTVAERIRGSFFRVKRVIWGRLRSAKKIRKMVWSRIKHGFFFTSACRRRRSSYNFLRLQNNHYSYSYFATHRHHHHHGSSCLW